jgi:uncharacterized protein with PIN domain
MNTPKEIIEKHIKELIAPAFWDSPPVEYALDELTDELSKYFTLHYKIEEPKTAYCPKCGKIINKDTLIEPNHALTHWEQHTSICPKCREIIPNNIFTDYEPPQTP